jgi:hypothetical protein
MKILADKTEVPARIYYYLLDWNEKNSWEFMTKKIGKEKLCQLNKKEFKELFREATTCDYNMLITMG